MSEEPKQPPGGRSPSRPPGVFAPGAHFGSYILRDLIGQGGMARIYRAEHVGLRRSVALKISSVTSDADAEVTARFLHEARTVAAIHHPHVVEVLDVGVRHGRPYLALELLDGEDLEARLRAEGSLSERLLIELALPIISALIAVHDAGVVHRDLKPSNIFLCRSASGEIDPKLLDFGISKASRGLGAAGSSGVSRGTLQYMPPEALSGGVINASSDQYSLGVILYECVTGMNPFVADRLQETVRRISSADYPRPSAHALRPSRALEAIIQRVLDRDPARRFKSLHELGRALLQLAPRRRRAKWRTVFAEPARPRSLDSRLANHSVAEAPIPSRAVRRGRLVAALLAGLTAATLLLWGAIGTWPSRSREPSRDASSEGPAVSTHALRPLPLSAPTASGATQISPRSVGTDREDAGARPPAPSATPPKAPRKPSEPVPEQPRETVTRPLPTLPDAGTRSAPLLRGTNNAPIFE